MDITKELVEKRLNDLKAARDQLLANLNATNGAIADSEFYLAELATVAPVADATVPAEAANADQEPLIQRDQNIPADPAPVA